VLAPKRCAASGVRQALRSGVHCRCRRDAVPPHPCSSPPEKSPLPHTAGAFFVAGRHVGSTLLALRLLSTGVNSGRGTGDLDHCQTWPASNDQPLFTVSRDALHPISPEGAAPGTYRCSRVALTDRGQTPDLPQVRLAMLGDDQPRG